jgi:hypothetical protein
MLALTFKNWDATLTLIQIDTNYLTLSVVKQYTQIYFCIPNASGLTCRMKNLN